MQQRDLMFRHLFEKGTDEFNTREMFMIVADCHKKMFIHSFFSVMVGIRILCFKATLTDQRPEGNNFTHAPGICPGVSQDSDNVEKT
jgi:hypothetical protein